MEILIPLVILFGFFWFFVLAPQRRKQREHVAMQDEVAVGDEIITAGGLHGRVREAGEETVELEIAAGTVVRLDRRAVAARVPAHEPDETASATDGNPG